MEPRLTTELREVCVGIQRVVAELRKQTVLQSALQDHEQRLRLRRLGDPAG